MLSTVLASYVSWGNVFVNFAIGVLLILTLVFLAIAYQHTDKTILPRVFGSIVMAFALMLAFSLLRTVSLYSPPSSIETDSQDEMDLPVGPLLIPTGQENGLVLDVEVPAVPARRAKSDASAVPAMPAASVDRPAWVDEPGHMAEGVYYQVATVGPYKTQAECQHAAHTELEKIAKQYVDLALDIQGAAARLDLSFADLVGRVMKQQVVEKLESPSVGQMLYLHVQLQFDDKFRAEIKQQYRKSLVAERLWHTGAGVGVVLVLLGVVFGYVKLDPLTRGHPPDGCDGSPAV